MRTRGGFTLLELLLVCAIIGILGGVGILNLRNAIDRGRLSDGASQFAASLQRARSSAQRYDKSSVLKLSANPATTYTLSTNGETAMTYTLPAGVQITPSSAAAMNLTYSAPFGEINVASNAKYTIGLVGKSAVTYVKILGVTGKVYQSAIE